MVNPLPAVISILLNFIFSCVSELYMVSDRSPDFEGTWDFLDRRMSDIGMLISAKATVSVQGCICTW